MSLFTLNTYKEVSNAPYYLPTKANTLLEFTVQVCYHLSLPFLELTTDTSLQHKRQVLLETATYFVTAASNLLNDTLGDDCHIIPAYKTYLHQYLSPHVGMHKDAATFYVDERYLLFDKQINNLKANENTYNPAFLIATLTKWPLTEPDIISMKLLTYEETGPPFYEPAKIYLFKQMLMSSLGQLTGYVRSYIVTQLK